MILTWTTGLEQVLDMEQADLVRGFTAGQDIAHLARAAHRSEADTAKVLGDAFQYLGRRIFDHGRKLAAAEEPWRGPRTR